MALQLSGEIDLEDINVELLKQPTAMIGLDDSDVRILLDKPSGQIALSDAYGKSNASIVARTTTANEGGSIVFDITGSGTTVLYLTLLVVSGAGTLALEATSGNTVNIVNNVGVYTLNIAEDFATEGTESFKLELRSGSTSGPVLATSQTFTIFDTSQSFPIPSLISSTSLDEGYHFDFAWSDIPAGTYSIAIIAAETLDLLDSFAHTRFVKSEGIGLNTNAILATITGPGPVSYRLSATAESSATNIASTFRLAVLDSFNAVLYASPVLTLFRGPSHEHFLNSAGATSSTGTSVTISTTNGIAGRLCISTSYVRDTTSTAFSPLWPQRRLFRFSDGDMSVAARILISADTGDPVTHLTGSTPRRMLVYFAPLDGKTLTGVQLVKTFSTESGTNWVVPLLDTSVDTMVVPENEIWVVAYSYYASGTSNASMYTEPDGRIFTNSLSAFQRFGTVIYSPGTKVNSTFYWNTSMTGTYIGRFVSLLKVSFV